MPWANWLANLYKSNYSVIFVSHGVCVMPPIKRQHFTHELFMSTRFLQPICCIIYIMISIGTEDGVGLHRETALSLSHIQTLFDTSAADDFRKHVGKRRNCSKQAICPFATMFSALFNQYTYIFRDCSCLKLVNFKDICFMWERGV